MLPCRIGPLSAGRVAYFRNAISNGNRTEWSPIRSVIIRVITKLDDRAIDLFITSMVTDRIGRHEVLLPINHKNYNFREKKNSQVMKEREIFFTTLNVIA